jgi:hypothetical protein
VFTRGLPQKKILMRFYKCRAKKTAFKGGFFLSHRPKE